MVVDVLPALSQVPQRLSAIVGHLQEDAHHVDAIHIDGVGGDLGVIHRARVEVVPLLPGQAIVARAMNPALAVGRFDRRVEHVGIHRRHRETDAPELDGRQTRGDLAPRLAAVGRAMDCALRPAVDEREEVAAALITCRDEHVGIAWINHDVGYAGVVADREDLVPGPAAVGRFVKTAIAAGSPERTLCGDVDDVAIARIDDDAPDMFGALQTNLLPRFAGVDRLVNAVTVADAALAVVFARTDPHHFRIARIERDDTDRIGTVAVEDRLPRRTAVLGLPDATRRRGHVDDGGILRMNGDADDAA